MDAGLYEIAVRGSVGRTVAGALSGFELVSRDHGETRFRGWVADQSALHGTLEALFGLGLELRSVQRIDVVRETNGA
jgi:hypothetical protein